MSRAKTMGLVLVLLMGLLGVGQIAVADENVDDPEAPELPDGDRDEDDDEDDEHDTNTDTGGPRIVTDRIAGETRFETSVAISQYEFPGGASEVYLANAEGFADAVAAGSLKKGPVLLVPADGEVPQVVLDEIARLHPRKVVALGGVFAVSDDVLEQAAEAAAQRGNGRPDHDDDDDGEDSDHDDDGEAGDDEGEDGPDEHEDGQEPGHEEDGGSEGDGSDDDESDDESGDEEGDEEGGAAEEGEDPADGEGGE